MPHLHFKVFRMGGLRVCLYFSKLEVWNYLCSNRSNTELLKLCVISGKRLIMCTSSVDVFPYINFTFENNFCEILAHKFVYYRKFQPTTL